MSSVIHAAAGAAGGIVAMGVTYPLIFISTRAAVEATKPNKSTTQAVLEIVTKEGLLGLYAGLSSSLLGIAVTNGVYYYFYERTREAILRSPTRKGTNALTTIESMLSGFIAGMSSFLNHFYTDWTATTILSNPIWVVQVTQATQTMDPGSSALPETKRQRGTILQTIKLILRKHGLLAFWRGLGPALILVINPIIQYTLFEQLKNSLIRTRTAQLRRVSKTPGTTVTLSDLDFFWLGAVSKLVATTLTYPYIVVKSRLQANSAQSRSYTSSLDGFRRIIEEESLSGLYKGLSSKLVQSVLTAAILFAGQRRIYEIINTSTRSLSRIPLEPTKN